MILDEYLIDYFISNKITYIYFNPAYFYNLEKEHIKINDELGNNIEYTIKKTNVFNIAFFIEIFGDKVNYELRIKVDKYNYNKKIQLKEFNCEKTFLQATIMMKDEYSFIPQFIDYYKNYHTIERFIIFDNNSTDSTRKEEFLKYIENKNDIIYIEFNMPYIFHHNFKDTDCKAAHFIIAQNTCYSISLKKFTSTWTMLFDLDEYLIFNGISLKNRLSNLTDSIESVKINGYWTGCNGINKEYFDPYLISKRSNQICNPKNILKNDKNDFTICIHWVKNNKSIELNIDDTHFLHLKTLSIKNRICNCLLDCSVDTKLIT